MRIAVFEPLSPSARAAFANEYLRRLQVGDGLPCMRTRTLPTREIAFRELEARPVRCGDERRVVQTTFDRNTVRRTPEPGLDELTLWALAVAKSNRAERYGIDYKLAYRGFEPEGVDSVYTFVELQELYHSRILLGVLDVVGVRTSVQDPRGFTKVMVKMIGSLPHYGSDTVAIMAEFVGVTLFRLLRDKARELLRDEPAASERVEHLFRSILLDEIGHVRFLQSRLDPARHALVRALFPRVVRLMLDDIPELGLLFGWDRVVREILHADLDAIEAGCRSAVESPAECRAA